MIHKVHIQNVKSLRDVSIELERFTVFVGANGSGKTTVLEAINKAVRAAVNNPDSVFVNEWNGDRIYTRGGTSGLSIRCETTDGWFDVEASPPKGHLGPELIDELGSWNYRVSPSGAELSTTLEPVRRTTFLRLNAAVMARPSCSQHDPPRVAHNGAGLASVMAYMALNDPQGFKDLEATARTLIPRLRRIRFRKATVHRTESELVRFGNDTVNRNTRRSYEGDLILLDFEHMEGIHAQTASEGTILMLGLLTVLLGPNRPQILLLDDIEQSLHPLAQKQMVEAIGQILEKEPDLQLVATSHSPYLLNDLSPEQVRIMAAGPDGYALCGRLTGHPKFPRWKQEMDPGEMWSLFGEKWLADQSLATTIPSRHTDVR